MNRYRIDFYSFRYSCWDAATQGGLISHRGLSTGRRVIVVRRALKEYNVVDERRILELETEHRVPETETHECCAVFGVQPKFQMVKNASLKETDLVFFFKGIELNSTL